MKRWKRFRKILSGEANIPFRDVVAAAKAFGFQLVRVNGSHHIFAREDIPKLLNLQNCKGKAKPYQIRQFILLVEEYNLDMEEDEE